MMTSNSILIFCLVFLLAAVSLVLSSSSQQTQGFYVRGIPITIRDPCRNLRCQNGGRCMPSGTRGSCQCPSGYSGTRCQRRDRESRRDRDRYVIVGTRQQESVADMCQNTQCSLSTTCRACLSCDTCQPQSQCASNQVLIRGLDIECQVQNYQEAVLVTRNDGSLPYMQLKCKGPLAKRTDCPYGSVCINDGRGGGTCCMKKVVPNYLDNKPGSCPTVSRGEQCRGTSCRSDSDCAGAMKCCPSCGNKCVSPVQQCTSGCNSDPCQGYNCQNGGRCVARSGRPSCTCRTGFTGSRCQNVEDPCQGYNCRNGGRCISRGQTPSCRCREGYTGDRCETEIDPCQSYTCRNGGWCTARGRNPSCNCPQGYTGTRCDSRIDDRLIDDDIYCGSKTCGMTDTCRACSPCPTCEPQGMCAANRYLTRDLDVECQVQQYQEAVLVLSNDGRQPYEQMRCGGPLAQRTNCPYGSVCISDGRGGAICCRKKVTSSFFQNKPGSCPSVSYGMCGGITCRRDSDCAGGQKCCSGCGNQCISPTKTSSPCTSGCGQTQQSGGCPVMSRAYPSSSFYCYAMGYGRECYSDQDCSWSEKCCSNQCGQRVCTQT